MFPPHTILNNTALRNSLLSRTYLWYIPHPIFTSISFSRTESLPIEAAISTANNISQPAIPTRKSTPLPTWIRISHATIIRMIQTIRNQIHVNKLQSKPKLIFTIKYTPNPLISQPSHKIPHIDLSNYQSVGILAIDGDHRIITLMYNGIVNELNGLPSIDNESASRHISPLIYGIAEHFKAEEQEMSKVCFPGRFPHKAQHDYFLSEIANLIDSQKSGTSSPDMLITFIGRWWKEHTVNSDSHFGNYLTGQRLPTSTGNYKKYL